MKVGKTKETHCLAVFSFHLSSVVALRCCSISMCIVVTTDDLGSLGNILPNMKEE